MFVASQNEVFTQAAQFLVFLGRPAGDPPIPERRISCSSPTCSTTYLPVHSVASCRCLALNVALDLISSCASAGGDAVHVSMSNDLLSIQRIRHSPSPSLALPLAKLRVPKPESRPLSCGNSTTFQRRFVLSYAFRADSSQNPQ